MSKKLKYRGLCQIFLAALAFIAVVITDLRAAPAQASDPDSFRAAWDAGKVGTSRPGYPISDGAMDSLLKLRLEKGIANLYPYAAALNMEALEAERQNQATAVSDLFSRARDLAPDFWGTDFAQSRMALGRGQIINAFIFFVQGAKRKFSSVNGSLPMLFNTISAAVDALIWTIILFSALLIARYSTLVAHDLKERIRGFSGREAQGLAVAILFFPLAFVPNVIVYAYLLILMLWVYMGWRERIIAAVFVAMLVLAPLPFRVMGSCIAVSDDPVFQSMLDIREGAWDKEDIRVLEQARQSPPNNDRYVDITFSLADALQFANRFEEAESLYKELAKRGSLQFESALMLGNLYHRWQKYDQALKQYQAAEKMMPDSFAAHFNLAAALSRPELVDLQADYVERADGELDKAKQIDPQRMEVLTRYQLLTPGLVVENARIPLSRFYDNVLENSPIKSGATQSMFSGRSGGIPLKAMPFVSLGLLLCMGVLTWVGKRFKPASACKRCGKTFCPHCQKSIGQGDVCVRCYYAFEQTTGMDPRLRERVRAEARLYMDNLGRIAQIISIILPGSGHLLMGKTIRGVIFGFVSFVFILGVAFHNGIMRTAWPNPAPAVLLPIIVASLFYVIFLLIVAWNAGASHR